MADQTLASPGAAGSSLIQVGAPSQPGLVGTPSQPAPQHVLQADIVAAP